MNIGSKATSSQSGCGSDSAPVTLSVPATTSAGLRTCLYMDSLKKSDVKIVLRTGLIS